MLIYKRYIMKVNDWHYEGYMGGRIECDIAPINPRKEDRVLRNGNHILLRVFTE